MKAGLLSSLKPTRQVAAFPTTPTGFADFVDQLEQVPSGKIMLVTFAGIRASSGGGNKNVELFVCPENLRGKMPVDPNLTTTGIGPDIDNGMCCILNSQQNASALQQGFSAIVANVLIPYGYFMKAVMPQTSGNGTQNIIYFDYFWTFIPGDCDIEL